MTQALYAHMSNKKKKSNYIDQVWPGYGKMHNHVIQLLLKPQIGIHERNFIVCMCRSSALNVCTLGWDIAQQQSSHLAWP